MVRALLIVSLLLWSSLLVAGCDRREGPAEELGRSVDETVDDISDAAEREVNPEPDLGDRIEEEADDAADAIEEAGEDLEDAADENL